MGRPGRPVPPSPTGAPHGPHPCGGEVTRTGTFITLSPDRPGSLWGSCDEVRISPPPKRRQPLPAPMG